MTSDGYVDLTNLIDNAHRLLDAEDCKFITVNLEDKHGEMVTITIDRGEK